MPSALHPNHAAEAALRRGAQRRVEPRTESARHRVGGEGLEWRGGGAGEQQGVEGKEGA